jgi:Lrp/AsnC family transcriptional regulator for asnA, asnC and gidA
LKLKNREVALDRTDFEILKALQEDSRQTYTAIGKRLGIAHSTVYDRIRKMEDRKIIKSYTTLVDLQGAGLKNILAIVTVYTDPKQTEAVAEKLAKSPEVLEVYTSLSDELLIMTKVMAGSQEELHEFIADQVAPLEGVLRIRTSVITKRLKETCLPIMDCAKRSHL